MWDVCCVASRIYLIHQNFRTHFVGPVFCMSHHAFLIDLTHTFADEKYIFRMVIFGLFFSFFICVLLESINERICMCIYHVYF